MAKSTSSQHRALIRDLSKDMNRTRNSSGSSRHSQHTASREPTVSDFDPENEAIMSTRPLNDEEVQRLPELRTSAQKYNRFGKPQQKEEDYALDYAIDTSAVARAFPDFTQGSSSFEPDSPSIEIGRGAKKSNGGTIGKLARSEEYSSNAQLDLNEDSFDSSKPMSIGGGYQLMYTPPIRSRQTSKKTEIEAHGQLRHDAQPRRASGLRKEVVDPSLPLAKTKDYGSGESRKASGESQRTVASMQARVRDENDSPHMSEEKRPSVGLTARKTRFGNVNSQQTGTHDPLPTRFSTAQTLMKSVAPKKQQNPRTVPSTNPGTQQSFVLPPMPNMSELISGVFDNGTPVFSRDGKPSRFVAALQRSTVNGVNLADVDEIPMRVDEQAIFLNLQLLQDKVKELEKINAALSDEMCDLERKNRILEGEKEFRQRTSRRDSALGTSESEGANDVGGGQRRLLVEKSRLESSVRALQTQIDALSRKASTAETILENITTERDAAVSQLSVAWCTIEQLKAENEDLKAGNDDLNARMGQMTNHHDNETQRWEAKKEAVQRKHEKKIEAMKVRMGDAGVQSSGLQNEIASFSRFDNNTETQRCDAPQTAELAHKDVNTMFDLSVKQDAANDTTRDRRQHLQIDDSQDSEDSIYEAPKNKGKGRSQTKHSRPTKNAPNDETPKDLTYLSFIDTNEIAKLRKTLEQERIERKQHEALRRQPSKGDHTLTQAGLQEVQPQRRQQTLPRKSSMKDLTARSALEEYVNEPSINSTKAQAEHDRRHSETSILSIRSRRRGLGHENLTSAFIIPDITIRNVPEMTKEAQDILNGLANHRGHNCTVCKREMSNGENHDHSEMTKKAIKIPKPVPVSDRIREATEDEDEPTMRPSQPPGVALATVLKCLDDELAHLKIKLAKYEKIYNGHNPALDRRRRKSVHQHIQSTREEIEVKSDQIYALYDVLEGQKQASQEMSDEEAEMTMQSIGLDPSTLHLRGGGDEEQQTDKPAQHHPWDLESDAESNDGLPWEGIESTS